MKMRKFDVYFYSEQMGEFNPSKINAETHEDAFKKYISDKEPNKYKMVVVDPGSFWESLSTSTESFLNPKYIQESSDNESLKKNSIAPNQLSVGDSYGAENGSHKSQPDKLDKLIELQEKQLHWIRFLGMVTLISLIIAFVYILITMSSGRSRY
jgi:hypothetical protein